MSFNKYPHVFSPIKIGNMEVKNRIQFSPMVSSLSTPTGGVSQELLGYIKYQAQSGVGVITIGSTPIDHINGVDFFGALDVKMTYVDKPLLAGSYFDKSAEAHKACYNALVDSADFGILCDSLDYAQRLFRICEIGRSNKYGAVIVNINLTVALCANFLDNLTLLADNITDLFGIDLCCEHLGSIL